MPLKPDSPVALPPEPDYSPSVRVRRALARRFPRLHRLYNWTIAYLIHLRAKYLIGRLRRLPASAVAVRDAIVTLLGRRREHRLTIAVDIASFWEPLTGIGWYLYRLLENLAHRDDLRLRLYSPTTVWSGDLPRPVVELPVGPAIELVERAVPGNLLVPSSWLIRLLRRLEPLLIAADGNDVLFAPNFFLPGRFRLAGGARVATIHDLGIERVPWTLRKATKNELREKLEHQVHECERLITVSAAVRDELVRYGYADRQRVRVIHHGPGQLSTVEPGPLPSGTPARYGLHVGTLEPRKNIIALLDAWQLVRRRLPDCPQLVLCGKYGWKAEAIRRAVQRAVGEGWAIHLGYVDDPQLAALYRRAEVVVFPTIYEGFGLPAVEALFAGAPLVCSDLPVLRESAGDAALFVPLGQTPLLADAIESALSDQALRSRLIDLGHRRTGQLSWNRAAGLTARVWFEAAGRPGGKSPQ